MSHAWARFLCCERPAWQTTATPVGICVSLTADSVLLTCWPPAPPERIVSVRTSDSLMSILVLASTTGNTATLENGLRRGAFESKGDLCASRCTPPSVLSHPYALWPLIWMVADLMPAS